MILSKVNEIVALAKEYVSKGYKPLDAVILAQKVIEFNDMKEIEDENIT